MTEALLSIDRWVISTKDDVPSRYLRGQRSYNPPRDVTNIVLQACVEAGGSEDPDMLDFATKFAVITKCCDRLKHPVPNSLLHTITSAGNESYCILLCVYVITSASNLGYNLYSNIGTSNHAF